MLQTQNIKNRKCDEIELEKDMLLHQIKTQIEKRDENYQDLKDLVLELMNELKVDNIQQFENIILDEYPQLEWTIEICKSKLTDVNL